MVCTDQIRGVSPLSFALAVVVYVGALGAWVIITVAREPLPLLIRIGEWQRLVAGRTVVHETPFFSIGPARRLHRSRGDCTTREGVCGSRAASCA